MKKAPNQIPAQPGVYFFMQGKSILYIGKATSLKERIKSYFSHDLIETRGQAIFDMVFKATSVQWQQTDTALEALILEAALIKKHQPKYNTKEKDNRSFNYVVVTNELLPRVEILRGRTLKIEKDLGGIKTKYIFGPFTSGTAIREGLRIIRKIFPYVDSASIHKDKHEFYKQLGLTPDTNNKEALSAYQKNIRHIVSFFKGKKKEIIKELEKTMHLYAKKQAFEKAQEVKKKLFALTHINDIALIRSDFSQNEKIDATAFRIEAYDVAHMSGKEMVGVMTVSNGASIDKNEYRKFILKTVKESNDPKALEEILMRRFRHSEWGLPDLVLVDGNEVQKKVAERVINFYSLKIPVIALVKDPTHKPKYFIGDEVLVKKHKKLLLLLNSEAHRFSIAFHRQKRAKTFIKKALRK